MKTATRLTATAVLRELPASLRIPREQLFAAEHQLRRIADHGYDFTLRLLAQGVLWSDVTGRTTGTVAMALRRATPWQAAQLLAAMANDGLALQAEVPAWLNANALTVLGG